MGICANFLDLDGCILTEHGEVNDAYFNALSSLSNIIKRRYPSFRLASGRDRNSVEIMSMLLGIGNCLQIIENGAYLFNPITYETRAHPAITLKTKKIFESIKRKIIPAILGQFPNLSLYPGELTCITLIREKGSPIYIDRIYPRIRRMLAEFIRRRILTVRCSASAIFIAPYRVNKGTAAKFLAEIDNIELSDSLAIGDSRADIPLFRRVGIVGCPSNACEACKEFTKQKRGRISHSNYAIGVLDIIEYYSKN